MVAKLHCLQQVMTPIPINFRKLLLSVHRLSPILILSNPFSAFRFFNLKTSVMPKFVIEREIPGAGNLSREALQTISQQSCAVLNELGPSIQWIQSFVGGDKIYCIYNAPSEELIRLHAAKGGFPANVITRISHVIDPITAEVE
jgi:hypothetical protein